MTVAKFLYTNIYILFLANILSAQKSSCQIEQIEPGHEFILNGKKVTAKYGESYYNLFQEFSSDFYKRTDTLKKVTLYEKVKEKREKTLEICYTENGTLKEFSQYKKGKLITKINGININPGNENFNLVITKLDSKNKQDTITTILHVNKENDYPWSRIQDTKTYLLNLMFVNSSVVKSNYKVSENINLSYRESTLNIVNNDIVIIDSSFREKKIHCFSGINNGSTPELKTLSENKSTKKIELKKFAAIEKNDEFVGYILFYKQVLKSFENGMISNKTERYNQDNRKIEESYEFISGQNHFEHIYKYFSPKKSDYHVIVDLEFYNKK